MAEPREPLSQVEAKLYRYLLDYLAEHTYQPSVREIARHFRIPSTKTVTDLLGVLERKGYIRRTAGRSRGVVLIGYAGSGGTLPVPVVRLGPDRRFQEEEHLTLDRSLVPSEEAYLVRALIEDAPAHGVKEGDLLLVHPGARVEEDAPVVVRVGGAVLVRAIERRGSTMLLRAPRAGAETIELGATDDFEILGPLAGVLRLTRPMTRG